MESPGFDKRRRGTRGFRLEALDCSEMAFGSLSRIRRVGKFAPGIAASSVLYKTPSGFAFLSYRTQGGASLTLGFDI